jgi:serine-type D-Ala-D-Ala carboxypeptidase/endopeptidase (penicillin-binding protein 4)
MFQKKNILLLLLSNIFSQVSAQPVDFAQIWKQDRALKNASISYCVMDAKSGVLKEEYNSNTALIPASTLKILTTSAALGILGKNYRYETKIHYTGTFDRQTGILNGDLIITGSGDPSLQSEYFTKENNNITDVWAKAVKEMGVKELRGKITGDASAFEQRIPGDWIWSDISNYFGAAPCGLSFNDNKFQIVYNSKEAGSKATIINSYPEYMNNTYTLTSDVTAGGTIDDAYVYGDPGSYSRKITGTIPPHKTKFEIEAALPDPALLCAESFYTSLKKAGITCNKNLINSVYKREDTLLTRQLIYTHYSPALEKLIYFTNMKSNNHYCESFLWTLGKGKMKSGIEQVKNFWKKKGLDTDAFFMVDGSGLSRANALTTLIQAHALSKIYNDSALYEVMNASLPLAGKSGGMASLGKATPIENNMRAKTGYIERCRAYCGYVKNRSGQELAFSIIFNNYNCPAKEAKLKMEKFLVALENM